MGVVDGFGARLRRNKFVLSFKALPASRKSITQSPSEKCLHGVAILRLIQQRLVRRALTFLAFSASLLSRGERATNLRRQQAAP